MSKRTRISLARLYSAVLSLAILAFVATVAAPAIYAQEKPAPNTPPGTERTEKVTEQATHGEHAMHGEPEVKGDDVTKAVAVLTPSSGSSVHGVITFTKEGDGIHVTGKIEGLTPGTHGFHVHEFGDCSAPDATSAGGHFNPSGEPHAAPEAEKRHEGDLGNVEADANGVANYDRVDKVLKFNGKGSIIGRSVVVHGNPDDLKSQPAGNAGPRVACGVIGIAKP
jgi:Cu-Zn family superoxide dismutase